MEPVPVFEFNRRPFVVHATEAKGGKNYVIRRFEDGRNIHFILSKLEKRSEGAPAETMLAIVDAERMKAHPNHLYLQLIRNHAETVEGTKALGRLLGYVEEHAMKSGMDEVSAMAMPFVLNFLKKKGYAPTEEGSKERVDLFRRRFVRFRKLGVEVELAKAKALANPTDMLIAVTKKLGKN